LLIYYGIDDNGTSIAAPMAGRATRSDLMNAFMDAGHRQPALAFDGHQSAFRLRLRPVAAWPKRKPRKRIAGRGSRPVEAAQDPRTRLTE
jgi:hypothetical protein